MLRDRIELEENLIPVLHDLKSDKKTIKDIKLHLEKYDISAGKVQKWLKDSAQELNNLDLRQLFLLTEQAYQKSGKEQINPELYFTKSEVDESRQYSDILESEQDLIEFPYTIPNVLKLSDEEYTTILDVKTIYKLMKSNKLHYNFEIQREAKVVKRKDQIIFMPTLNMENVKQIKEHLINDTLLPTDLKFNAAIRTSETGSELVYDPKRLELSIQRGSRIDILDGFHRCKAIESALDEKKDIDFKFTVMFTNYGVSKAQKFQSQIAKATPISKVRAAELEASRPSDMVVQEIKRESDLKGRVSQTNRIHYNEVVSYNVLADTIDELFPLNSRIEIADASDYLVEFFNFLLGYYPEILDTETRKNSIIGDNNMFVGYLTLAKKMMDKNIKPKEVRKYLKGVDFSRNNTLWTKELGILDDKGNITDTNKFRKTIKEYFEQIKI